MGEFIAALTVTYAIVAVAVLYHAPDGGQDHLECSATTVCVLDDAATDRVFDCMQRRPTDDLGAGPCLAAHRRTCERERGFVCGKDLPLSCTLAFEPAAQAACAP